MQTTNQTSYRFILLWFKRDLRTTDHYGITQAVQQQTANTRVIPFYCLDPRDINGLSVWGQPKMGPHRLRFLQESLNDLRENLASSPFSSHLHILTGHPETAIPQLCQKLMAQYVGSSGILLSEEEFTSEECAVETGVKEALPSGWKLQTHATATLVDVDDLPIKGNWQRLPDSFTTWRKWLEKAWPEPRALSTPPASNTPLLPLPEGFQWSGDMTMLEEALAAHPPPQISSHDASVTYCFRGGATAAQKRIYEYFFSGRHIDTYLDTRNEMLGANYSTKFSPYLANGSLSPRQIYHALRRYEKQHGGQTKSTYWLIFELLWRDYFFFYFRKHGAKPFHLHGVVPRTDRVMLWDRDPVRFAIWRDGRTGFPLVDANMREMAATGFMSNRGRQNVASFLIHDLGLDWRMGADWFESSLLDYDVSANWGNWHALAGLQGGRVNRFNTVKQSKQYDDKALYIKHWLPELSQVPSFWCHEPHRISVWEASTCGFKSGRDYPKPMKTQPWQTWKKEDGKGKGTSRKDLAMKKRTT